MPNATEPQDGRPVNKSNSTTIRTLAAFALIAAIVLCFSLGTGLLDARATALALELQLETAAESDSSESPDGGDDSGASQDGDGSGASQDGDTDEDDFPDESSEASNPFEPTEEESSGADSEEAEEEDTEGYGGLVVIVTDYDYEQRERNENDFEATQGDASFEGIAFDIYNKKGKKIDQIVAEQDGYAALDEEDFLPLGTYVVKLDGDSARARGYEPNSDWVSNGVTVAIDEDDTYADAGTCPCKVIRGEVQLNLVDGELFDTLGINDRAQGKAKLDGAVFELYNGSAHSVVIDDKLYKPYQGGDSGEPIMELTTDESGFAYSSSGEKGQGLPWGTYVMKQKKASKGYKGPDDEGNDENGEYIDLENRLTGTASVRGNDVFGTDDAVRAEAKHGGVKITMVDAETADGSAQGDATLKGAVFEVLSANGDNSTVIHKGEAYANGDVILKLTTNAKGLASTATDELPFGTYKIRMCKDKGTRSYAYDSKWSAKLKVKKNGKRATLGKKKAFAAKVVHGGVTLKRLEKVSKKPVSGGSFEVVNASKKAVVVGGKSYEPGAAVLKLKVSDEGVAKSGKSELPYGTYTLRESGAGEGHKLNSSWKTQFKIRKAEKVIDAGSVFDEALPEEQKEEKKDEVDSSIPILPFIIILLIAAAGAAGVMMFMRKRDASAENGTGLENLRKRTRAARRNADVKHALENNTEAVTASMETAALSPNSTSASAAETVAMGASSIGAMASDTVAMESDLLHPTEGAPQGQEALSNEPTSAIAADDIFGAATTGATQALGIAIAADVKHDPAATTAKDTMHSLDTIRAIDISEAPAAADAATAKNATHALDAIKSIDISAAPAAADNATLYDTVPADFLEDAARVLDAQKAFNADEAANVTVATDNRIVSSEPPINHLEDVARALASLDVPNESYAATGAIANDDANTVVAKHAKSLEGTLPPAYAPASAAYDDETTGKLYPIAEAAPSNDLDQTRGRDTIDETIEFGAVKPLMPYDLSGKQHNKSRKGFFKRGR